jgi:hypothetical protein
MQYYRSRPWGPRSPGFANRTGSRRRGHVQGLEQDALMQSDASQNIALASPSEATPALAGSVTQQPRLVLLALGHHGQARARLSSSASTSSLGQAHSPLGDMDKCRTA